MFLWKIISSATVFTLFLSLVPSVQAFDTPYPDMEHSWYRYKEAVTFLRDRGVIEGNPDGTFRPKNPINRAELLKIIFKGRSDITPVTRRCFSDINPDEWYAPFVCAAKNRGIVDGYPDGTFKADKPVNFAEAIKMILNAYDRDITEGVGEFWYQPYTSELHENDVLSKFSYIPSENLTRERAADILARILRFDEDRVIPRLSPGCGKAAPQTSTSLNVNGIDREFLLTIPTGYISHDTSPLIIAFHGRTNSNAEVRAYYGLDRAAEEFFIAYPAALRNQNGSFSWSDAGNKPNEIRDIAFFDAIVERLANDYCIDMDRIFVVGHSLGAWMANSVACVRGGIVRASGTVGGDSVITDCSGPSAALIAHNPNDTLAPFSSTERARDMRVEENLCKVETNTTQPQSLLCERYLFCSVGNDVVWCPHRQDHDFRGSYYPHTWPDGFGNAIVQFFRSLP